MRISVENFMNIEINAQLKTNGTKVLKYVYLSITQFFNLASSPLSNLLVYGHLHILNFIFQDASPCSVKTDGLKRGLQSIESADYQMGEAISGIYCLECRGNPEKHEFLNYIAILQLWKFC